MALFPRGYPSGVTSGGYLIKRKAARKKCQGSKRVRRLKEEVRKREAQSGHPRRAKGCEERVEVRIKQIREVQYRIRTSIIRNGEVIERECS